MAYSQNLLPKSAAYYTLNRATISGTNLILEAGGSAEINLSSQMLAQLTTEMLVVIHPSVFSNGYSNDAVQVTLSLITSDGTRTEYLIPAQYSASGVFNTVIALPEGSFVAATYKIFSVVPATVYNWELCATENVDVTAVIGGVEQALPRLLYDYNTYAYAVGQKETTVGLISCFLRSATDLQGHFTLSFFATERCNVHVRIKDNGITELYTPQVYTVEQGYASISIPHAYLKKLADSHNFSVTLQCTNGQLSIPVRGLLYTIDGGYLATRLLDAGVDIIDLSIKQTEQDTKPSELWTIGFEGDRLILKKAPYDLKAGVVWEAVKDFGEGLVGVVEFAGRWVSRDRSDKYTIETQETPYVGIVDTIGNLTVYSGSTFEAGQLIDTNVSKVAMCQGFNSMLYEEQDQGLVIAYIKEGNVYYKQLLYSAIEFTGYSSVYTNGDATDVSVHRLPDYRLGICITHASGVKWYITDRTYVGQSVKVQYCDVSMSEKHLIAVVGTDRLDEAVDTPTIKTLTPEDRWHTQILLTFASPLGYVWNASKEALASAIVAKVNGIVKELSSVIIEGNTILLTFAERFAGGLPVEVSAVCPGVVLMLYNGCRTSAKVYASFTPPLPIKTYELVQPAEKSNVTVINASITPIVGEILTTPEGIKEAPVLGLTPLVNIAVGKTVQHTIVTEEKPSITVSHTVSISVSQTGTSPV